MSVAGLLLAGLLGGCGAPPTTTEAPPPPPAAPAQAPSPPATAPAGRTGTGLVPLPTRQEVVNSVPVGRSDPFGDVLPRLGPSSVSATAGTPGGKPGASGAAAGNPAGASALPPAMPEGFRLAGVIRSGGRSEAVVQVGGRSGTLRPGDRGGRTTDLLPPGWTVAAIDVNRGSLTLQQGGRRITAEL